MTPPTATTEDDLEAQLRAVLARRAATIDGPAPPLPVAPALAAVVPLRRRRWIVGAVAAAAVVVLVAGIVVVSGDRNDRVRRQVVATQPTGPAGLLPDRSFPLFHVDGDAGPAAVARAFLLVRLGDGTEATDRALRRDLRLHAQEAGPDGTVVVTWRNAADPRSSTRPVTSVLVRPGAGGSDVVGATIDAVDLSGIRYDVGHLRGRLPGTPGISGYGDGIAAWLDRRGGSPLLEPDVPVRAGEGEAVGVTIPTGGERFDVPVTESGDLELTVAASTSTPDGPVPIGLAVAGIPAPADPAAPDLSTMSRDQIAEWMAQHVPRASDSPACREAGAWHMPDHVPFPSEVVPNGAAPADDVVQAGVGEDPAAAVANLGRTLDVTWDLAEVHLATADSAYGVARLGDGRLVDVEVYRQPGSERWVVTSARTRGACRDFGGSNVTPLGAPNPKTRLGLPVVVGAAGGDVWFRTGAGTERAAIAPADVAAHAVVVPADQAQLTGRVIVLRTAEGRAALVDLSRDR